jgi:hypothetical protein
MGLFGLLVINLKVFRLLNLDAESFGSFGHVLEAITRLIVVTL